ncbi:MAG: cell envelope integrity protein TolA [Faecalibacterium prausnitzii]
MRRKKLLRQVAAAAVALSMAVSLSAPAFAATFDLSNGGLVITAGESGITVTQDGQTGSTSVSYDDTIEIKGSYSSPNGAALTAEENQQDENQPVTPAKAPAKASAKEETPKENSEETSGAENAPAAEEKQEQKDTENLTDPEQKTETENKDNNSDPADEEKKEQNAPANGELNASAGEGQESKAEDEDKPKTEAKASAEASTSASDDASNGSRKAPARSSGEKSEIRGIIQIFANTLVKLTLKDATIDQPNAADTSVRGRAAIDIQGSGDVEITVKGDNLLTSNYNNAAIQKNDNTSTGKLTITAQDTDQKLTLKGYDNGAAIGGRNHSYNHYEDAAGTKDIEINNGTVVVDGDFGSKEGNATGIKITGDAVVNVTGDICGGYKNYNDDSECTTEIEISGKAQVNVKKIDNNGYIWGGNIGQLSGKNEKITISGNAKVNTEGCIGGSNEDNGSKNGVINISDNAIVKAHEGITGRNSTVNISGNANVTVGEGQIGGGWQSTSGGVTISDNAQVNGEFYGIECNLTLKDQAKIEGECTINGNKFNKDQASNGAVLDARINLEDGNIPDHTRQFKENGEWKDVSNRLDGNCNHAEGKTYLSETIPSTCSTPGEKIYRCFYCGSVAKTEPVACLPHTWVKGETVAPTCTQKGYTVYECSVCHTTENRNPTDVIDHTWVKGETVEPTCVAGGYTVYECSVCHATKRDDETEPTGIHTYTEPVETVAPTYTERGYTVYKCQNCDATEQRDWVPMLERESTNGAPNYTVTGAETYESSVVDGRYIIAVPSEDAALNAVLGDLRAIKAQGADVVVFRTRSRESSLVIDEMLAMGTDVTPFVLAHNGVEAQLTINGAAHNELIH